MGWAKYMYDSAGDADEAANSLSVKKTRLPFEDYYRRIRAPNAMTPDPPAYFRGMLFSEFLATHDWQRPESSSCCTRRSSKDAVYGSAASEKVKGALRRRSKAKRAST